MADEKKENSLTDPYYLLYVDRWRQTFDRFDATMRHASQAAQSYSSLLLRSAIYLNAGGLVVGLPAFLQFFRKDNGNAILFEYVMWAGVAFIVGLLFAVLSAYVTYLNYDAATHSGEFDRNHQLAELNAQLKAHRSGEPPPASTLAPRNKFDETVNRTYWFGTVFGFISYGALLTAVAIVICYLRIAG